MDISKYLQTMVDNDSSDLFLTTGMKPSMRSSGKLVAVDEIVLESGMTRGIANAIMNDAQRKEFEEQLEMNLAIATDACRFRVNIFQQKDEVALVLRKITVDVPCLDDLDVPRDILKDLIMQKRGLILVVGGTGSGKSTTLAAMIDHRNATSDSHIITVEDPMEFVHPHKMSIMEQREVGCDTLSYAAALKNTLRQAPDVILIGEIRDAETMEHAITFAETGHLCLSTLHANNANQTMGRITSFFPIEKQAKVLRELANNLRGVISQRLVRTVDEKLTCAMEILLGTPLAREMIGNGEFGELKEVMAKSQKEGMQTFDQSLYEHYKNGKITFDMALANADSANDLRLHASLQEDHSVSDEGEKTSTLSLKAKDEEEEDKPAEPTTGGLPPLEEK